MEPRIGARSSGATAVTNNGPSPVNGRSSLLLDPTKRNHIAGHITFSQTVPKHCIHGCLQYCQTFLICSIDSTPTLNHAMRHREHHPVSSETRGAMWLEEGSFRNKAPRGCKEESRILGPTTYVASRTPPTRKQTRKKKKINIPRKMKTKIKKRATTKNKSPSIDSTITHHD